MQTNYATCSALEALAILWPDELDDLFINFRSIHSHKEFDGRKLTSNRYVRVAEFKADPARWADWALGMAAKEYNVYFARNPVFSRKQGASRSWDVAAIPSFAMDIDYIQAEDALALLLKAGYPEPTLMIDSGYGVHVYWALRRFLNNTEGHGWLARFVVEGGKRVEGVDQRCRDPIRILRLPHTANWKKMDFSRHDLGLREVRTVHESGRDYAVSDLLDVPAREVEMAHERSLERVETERLHHDAIHGWLGKSQKHFIPKGITTLREAWRAMERLEERFRPQPSMAEVLLATPAVSGTLPTEQSSTPSLPSPSLPSSCVPLADDDTPCEDLERLDWEYMTALVEQVSITGEGHRSKGIARLVARVRKSATPSTGQLVTIFRMWWKRWSRHMSSNHTYEESLEDFLECWKTLGPPRRSHDDYVRDVLGELRAHPLQHLIRSSRTSEDVRQVASFLFSACLMPDATNEPWRCFLSVRLIGRALGMSKSAVSRHIKHIRDIGIVARIVRGDRKTGHASVYWIPGAARGEGSERDID